MAKCVIPPDVLAELWVVDNGSTDDTREVVQAAHCFNMPLKYVYEPNKGQCFARNRGMKECAGDVILFTDDDVRPPAHWIEGMCRPILSGGTDAVVGGIHMAPNLERPWLNGFLRGWLACTDKIERPERPHSLIGANMAFSRRVLDRVPGFDTELGPGALGFGDETLFSYQLEQAGYRLSARWDVVVEHHFGEERLGKDEFEKSALARGRSLAYIDYHWHHKHEPMPQFKRAARRLRLALRSAVSKSTETSGVPQEWKLTHLMQLAYFDQLALEQKLPRKYTFRGLVKLPAQSPSPSTEGVQIANA